MPSLVENWDELMKSGKLSMNSTPVGTCNAAAAPAAAAAYVATPQGEKVSTRTSAKLAESEATLCMLMDRFAPS